MAKYTINPPDAATPDAAPTDSPSTSSSKYRINPPEQPQQPATTGDTYSKNIQLTSPSAQAFGAGLLHGAGQYLRGAEQFISHLPDPIEAITGLGHKGRQAVAADIDKQIEESNRAWQASPTRQASPGFATAGNIAGEIAATAPLMLVPGGEATLPLRLARGAAQGAAAAAFEPVTTDDFWSKKSGQVARGAIGGGAGEAGTAALGRAIAPKVSPEVRELAGRNVRMTPGQLGVGGGHLGTAVRRTEEALKSFPILGNFIRGAEGRSIEDFNRAAINQALEPIGATLPQGVSAGHQAIGTAQRAVTGAYDRLLPNLTFQADPEFTRSIQDLRSLTTDMPPAQRRQFADVFRNRVLNRLGPQGNMDGLTLKQVESELGNFAANYRSSGDSAQRQLGDAVRQLQEEIRDSLMRQNPQAATQLKNINSSFAMLSRIEDAATRRGGTPEGVFRPTDLLAAVKAGDRSRRKRVFARGDALMQVFAKAGQKVLPGKMPDSGTTERAGILWGLVQLLGGIGGAHALGAPPELEAGAAALLGAVPVYTRPGQRAVQSYMLPGPERQAVGQAIGDLGPYLDPAFGIIAGSQQQ